MGVWKTVTEELLPLIHVWRVPVTPQITEAIETLNRDLIPKVTESIESLNCDLIPKVISKADAMESWIPKVVLGIMVMCSVVTAVSSGLIVVHLWKSPKEEKLNEGKKIPKSGRDEKQGEKEEDDDIRTSEL